MAVFNVTLKPQTFELETPYGQNFGDLGVDSDFEFDEDARIHRVMYKSDGYTTSWRFNIRKPGAWPPVKLIAGSTEEDVVWNEEFILPKGEVINIQTAGASTVLRAMVTASQL